MMSPSRRRWLKRIWIALSFIIFAATCAERAKPWLKNFARALGTDAAPAQHAPGQHSATQHAPGQHSEPAPHSPPARHSAHRSSLRIASWNLQFLDVGARGHEHRTDSDYAALRRYADSLDADVIAVQEVASTEALAQ